MLNDETDDAREAILREAVAAQREVFHALMRLGTPDWLELDLPTGQLKALVTLGTREGMTVSEIAEALHIGKPAASMLVDKLVHQGYARRSEDPNDRRRTIVVPSATGDTLVARLRQGGGEQRMTRLLRQMSADDLAALTRGMRALATIAERATTEATETQEATEAAQAPNAR